MDIKKTLKKTRDDAIHSANEIVKKATPIVKDYAEKAKTTMSEKVVPMAKEMYKDATKFTKETAIPKAKEFANNTIEYTNEKVIPKAKELAIEVKDFTNEKAIPAVKQAYETTKDKAFSMADLNGDGKIDQEDMIILLNDIYGQSVNGIKNVSKPVADICKEYLNRYKDAKEAAEHLVASDIVKCTTSGFLTGFGGLITLPITIPANVASVLYVQIRMIASVAYLSGLDVNSDATQTLVYACLAGLSIADIVKQTGIKLGNKIAINLVEKIPGKTLTAINKKVGFRMLTKFGETGVINIGKMIPVVGAIIGGGFDLVETKIVADRSIKQFFDGNFEIKEDSKVDVIDAEFKEIINEEENKIQ